MVENSSRRAAWSRVESWPLVGLSRMYPFVPEDMLEACIQMACYFVTMVGAMVGWLMTGRIA
jgi:hypothetical protein